MATVDIRKGEAKNRLEEGEGFPTQLPGRAMVCYSNVQRWKKMKRELYLSRRWLWKIKRPWRELKNFAIEASVTSIPFAGGKLGNTV